MDKLDRYREYVSDLLKKYAENRPSSQDVEVQVILDRENDHYQIVNVGWQNQKRIYGCVLHLDIKNGKIWLQHNGTERRIARELEERGVPRNDIVLAFYAPYRRQFTEYAVE